MPFIAWHTDVPGVQTVTLTHGSFRYPALMEESHWDPLTVTESTLLVPLPIVVVLDGDVVVTDEVVNMLVDTDEVVDMVVDTMVVDTVVVAPDGTVVVVDGVVVVAVDPEGAAAEEPPPPPPQAVNESRRKSAGKAATNDCGFLPGLILRFAASEGIFFIYPDSVHFCGLSSYNLLSSGLMPISFRLSWIA